MKVVHLPYYEDNAYQKLLMASLGKRGVETVPGGGGGNFFRTALWRWKADVLHFHWIHPYVLRPTVGGTLSRATRFLAEIISLKGSGQRDRLDGP